MPLYKKDAFYCLRKYLNPIYLVQLVWRWCKRLFFNPTQKAVYRGVLKKVRTYEAVMPYSTGFSYVENVKEDLMRFLPKHKDLAFWMRRTFITASTTFYNAEINVDVHHTLNSIICAVTNSVLLMEFQDTVSRYGTTASWIRPDLRTLKRHIEESQKELLAFHATSPDDCETVSKYLSDTIANDFPFLML